MMWRLTEVVSELSIEATVLNGWIEQRWVRPNLAEGEPVFDEADMARARLIKQLRRDFAVGDEAMPIVLQLLDQVYALRKALNDLTRAIKSCPESVQAEITERLK
ncbi:MAG TPA: chaperone modulator CbpM [Dongiaceae bacterium]|nr:chaperone modulator CbpM [Dongiaceae bacterium]